MNPVVGQLLGRRSELLGYLRKHGVPDDQAEDLLQSALERGLEPWRSLPAPDSAVAWFYSGAVRKVRNRRWNVQRLLLPADGVRRQRPVRLYFERERRP